MGWVCLEKSYFYFCRKTEGKAASLTFALLKLLNQESMDYTSSFSNGPSQDGCIFLCPTGCFSTKVETVFWETFSEFTLKEYRPFSECEICCNGLEMVKWVSLCNLIYEIWYKNDDL